MGKKGNLPPEGWKTKTQPPWNATRTDT